MAKILAVDDSALVRQIMGATLRGVGHEVVEAVDGVDALGKAQTTGFDLVISDINMPNMDGVALIRELRQLANFKLTPVLILTNGRRIDSGNERRASGVSGWIVKPINPDQLLEMVEEILGL